MENFEASDFIDIIKYYKNKLSDVELQYLTLQVNNKKEIEKKLKEQKDSLQKTFDEQTIAFRNEMVDLRKEIFDLTNNKNSKKDKDQKQTKKKK